MKRIDVKMMEVYSSKAHYHQDDLEIILVLKGSLTIHKVQRHLTIHEGQFTFINRFIVHSIESNGAKILSVKVRLSEFKDIFEKIEYVEFLNNDEIHEIERPLKERLNAIVVDLLIKLYYDRGDDKERRLNEISLVHLLFLSYQLISHTKNQEEYPTYELQLRYYSIVEYIMKHMDKKIEVEDILQEFYMNRAYFSQFMKKIGGEGFKTFLSYRKLIHILDQLIDDQLSMVEIAASVGILNMKSFYGLFKKYFEVSPIKWKEKTALIQDHYHGINEEEVLRDFIKQNHIDKHRDNTIYKLYKYLAVAKANNINMKGIDIVLNPYLDMGEDIDEDYQVYKFLDLLTQLIKTVDAHIKIIFPFRYLKDDGQKELLFQALRLQALQNGINELKKWKICFYIDRLYDYQEALTLKANIEKTIGGLNIQIALDAIGGQLK